MRKLQQFLYIPIITLIAFAIITSCDSETTSDYDETSDLDAVTDSLAQFKEEEEEEKPKILTAADIQLEKNFKYDEYTLQDEYPHGDTTRVFQWDKIKKRIAHIDNAVTEGGKWGVFINYRNANGEAPTVSDFVRNDYNRVADQYGVERFQSAPLYSFDGDTTLTRYGRDGWLVKIIGSDTTDMVKIQGVSFDGEYLVPKRYLEVWNETIIDKVAVVDIPNQNITTLEKDGDVWNILSMNPATTGLRNPPNYFDTPVGIFGIVEQKEKMYYTSAGGSEVVGFAPYASRFTNGAYIHGVPVQYPNQNIIEYSPTLGTIPRSQMCVRNASSHAKFVFDWVSVNDAAVVVID